jgi:hypothetical protein
MATEFNAYIPRNPGDLLTAEDWNDVQRRIKEDIAQQIRDEVAKIKHVAQSDSAHKLDDKTADELAKSILEQARQELPKRTGYSRIFKRLELGAETVIKHELGGYPLVDIYALHPFDVVCSEDDQKNQEQAYFFLYHQSERRIRFTPVGKEASPGPGIEIEPSGGASGTPFRIAFADMLVYYNVQYNDSSTLEDLETEFWDAFLKDPNDQFDDAERCHSPWFDRNSGERRTVGELKSRGDWDEIWFKVVPRKTINALTGNELRQKIDIVVTEGAGRDLSAPMNLEVVHYDFNTIGVTFLPHKRGEYPPAMEIQRVMLLLKV